MKKELLLFGLIVLFLCGCSSKSTSSFNENEELTVNNEPVTVDVITTTTTVTKTWNAKDETGLDLNNLKDEDAEITTKTETTRSNNTN